MANDIYEVKLFWADQDSKRAENVMNWQFVAPPISTDPFAVAGLVANGFLTLCQTQLLLCVSVDVTLTAITCRRVNNAGGPTWSLALNDAGTRTGATFSNAIAVNICEIPGAAPYRRKEGHFYLGGIVTTDVIGDAIQGALHALITTLYGEWSSSFTVSGALMFQVIFDRTTKIGTPIADYVIRPTITPMGRRLKPRAA